MAGAVYKSEPFAGLFLKCHSVLEGGTLFILLEHWFGSRKGYESVKTRSRTADIVYDCVISKDTSID